MKFAAVITETRYNLRKTINDHFAFLPDDFDCIVFQDSNEIGNIDCISYQVPRPINNLRDYNNLMTSEWYWNKLKDYDKVLIFQTDSGILRKGIEEFYEWDYIGALIKNCPYPAMNGGFSLRDVKLMKRIIKKENWSYIFGNEDIFYGNMAEKYGGNIAAKEAAMNFSVETIFGLGSFGFHAIDNWLTPEQCQQIRTQYETVNNI